MSKYDIDDKHFDQEHVEFSKGGVEDQTSGPRIEGNVQLLDQDGKIRLVPTPR